MWLVRLGAVPATAGVAALALSLACSSPEPRSLEPPAAPGSFAPDLWADDEGVLLTWIEPLGDDKSDGHRVRFSSLEGDTWSVPSTIVEGADLFANWADFPSVARAAGGALVAHWLAKTSDETYAYSIFLAASKDNGASWQRLGKLNEDDTPTEHGFVSWLREDDGLRAFWLDGREMGQGGAMTLRSARVGGLGGVAPVVWPSVVLDDRVCECCSTDAALTSEGPLVVYRDRSPEEIRDSYRVRWSDGGWSEPEAIASEGWEIRGCPVNGPEVAAAGRRVAAAWYTAAADAPAVRLAFSTDAGRTFGAPVLIDDDLPHGRLDLELDEGGGAVVSWLARSGSEAAVRLARVSADGERGDPITIAQTSDARAGGFPRLAKREESILIVWVDLKAEGGSRLRLRELRLDSIPL